MNKCKQQKIEEQQLNNQFQEATSAYQDSPTQENLSALNVLKEKMEQLYEKKVEGIIVRSRARWHEYGDNKHILKRHIGLFAKNLKDAIHGRVRRPAARNQPESQLLRHASYSNAVKNKPPYTHHWPRNLQTQPPLIPLVKPPAPHQTYTANTQIPPAPHQAGPHPFPETPHQTLPQAAKLVTTCEETPSSRNNMANAQLPQEIISFLRFVKSYI